MDSYEKLLKEAFTKVKKTESTGERFAIPKVAGRFEGKKTIITNFKEIASYFRRSPEHFQKFLLKELATPGQIEGDRLALNLKVPSAKINQKVEEYAREFVICKQCGKPDTELERVDRITMLRCLACGAKQSVRSKL